VAEPIRVALVNHTGRLGGGEFSMLRLVQSLDPERVAVTVMAGEDGPFVDRLREIGADVVVVPMDPMLIHRRKESFDARALLDPRLHRQLARAVWPRADVLRRRRIQIVHTNSMKAHVLGGVSGRAAGAKVLWHVRDHIAPPYLPAGAARAMRIAARVLPHHVVAVSASAARTVGRRDVTVLHQSVPLPTLNGERSVNGKLRIGIVGRFAPWKGQDVFLAAAEQLAPQFPEAEFVLAGSALFGEHDFERDLHNRADREPLRGRVRFLGFCDDVWSVYRDLDVAVHASTQAEPYGNVVLEAMASRTPIVAAAAGGPLEIVDDGENGLLVPPGDPEALASMLGRLLADPDERRRLGHAGRAHVERNFSLERDARRIEEIYRSLVA
jgi:glycosyltransferase involved in cell wall biosynthesis